MPKARQTRPPLVIAFTVALALLLVWPAWLAARNGLSGLYARPAIDYLQEKRFDAYTVSAAEWLAINSSVVQAHELMPGNPQYLEALGLLHQLELNLIADEQSDEEMDVHASAARKYFQEAVKSRPTWPYYWGNLALEQHRRGNYATGEYSQALTNAARFGPWKNDIQRLLLDLGSETWAFLSPGAKREFVLNVERALHRQPEYTIRTIRDYDAWPTLCAASNDLLDIVPPQLHAHCAENPFAE